jgi:hypothetical protein
MIKLHYPVNVPALSTIDNLADAPGDMELHYSSAAEIRCIAHPAARRGGDLGMREAEHAKRRRESYAPLPGYRPNERPWPTHR